MKLLLCIIDTLSSLPGRFKYSRIFSCPGGITPNSGLTGLSILYIYIYIYLCVRKCAEVCLYIYIYIYIYVVHLISFKTFLVWAFKIVVDPWKFPVIAIHLMRWLTNFYDFGFKWTATAAIGIHPTKAWLSQLVNFKNAIWTSGHFRRTICNKILF